MLASKKIHSHYPSQGSFLDPQKTRDGKPYGPQRYKELVRERYAISKITNTSYIDTGKITPLERKFIMEFIVEDNKREKESFEKSLQGKG